ncbi:class I SAM-dependent methyltransferase [Lichenihabitans psoromatis]|uniref:class I SAM-dependent methyltransferase n=1 Tax=Lichenihabitans psoromatis TaxID=2528642 RepID=UPI001FE24166|nr:class I SAM-dependent methyltransferase [Lichenihabitans psoromatis]
MLNPSTTGSDRVPDQRSGHEAGSHRKRVLNAGSGPTNADKLFRNFTPQTWDEVRLDIDPRTRPDLVGSIIDMRSIIPDRTFDAIWSSHAIEHLHTHEVVPALTEFRRILKPDGFVLLTCPDLTAVVRLMLTKGAEDVAYMSPSGPITALDMLFGHSASIAAGQTYMAHHTGMTIDLIGKRAMAAGFAETRVMPGASFDLWAVLMMPTADPKEVASFFAGTLIHELFV